MLRIQSKGYATKVTVEPWDSDSYTGMRLVMSYGNSGPRHKVILDLRDVTDLRDLCDEVLHAHPVTTPAVLFYSSATGWGWSADADERIWRNFKDEQAARKHLADHGHHVREEPL